MVRPVQKIAGFALASLILAAPAARAACTASAPPSEIGPEEAQSLYDCIETAIVETYANVEGVPGVPEFREWTVVSTSPFLSKTHGRTFINHIANPVALPLYTQWEGMLEQKLPAGAILAKESFEVTRSGEVKVGPLSLMEKAPPGTSPETDDWIYTQIRADGRLRRTGGEGGQYLEFCHECHSATIHHFDAMFFPPERYRINAD